MRTGTSSVKTDHEYHKLLRQFGNELYILRELSLERLETEGFPLLALALSRMRQGQVKLSAGYDGEYGVVSLLDVADFANKHQLSLF